MVGDIYHWQGLRASIDIKMDMNRERIVVDPIVITNAVSQYSV